jgi:hypothetical protein
MQIMPDSFMPTSAPPTVRRYLPVPVRLSCIKSLDDGLPACLSACLPACLPPFASASERQINKNSLTFF